MFWVTPTFKTLLKRKEFLKKEAFFHTQPQEDKDHIYEGQIFSQMCSQQLLLTDATGM